MNRGRHGFFLGVAAGLVAAAAVLTAWSAVGEAALSGARATPSQVTRLTDELRAAGSAASHARLSARTWEEEAKKLRAELMRLSVRQARPGGVQAASNGGVVGTRKISQGSQVKSHSAGRPVESVRVTIASGLSVAQIGAELIQAGVLQNDAGFIRSAQKKPFLIAGVYVFRRGESVEQLVRVLSAGG